MNYEQEKDDKVYYYYVTYDENKLREILEELKKYNYVYVSEGKLNTSYVTNFPIIVVPNIIINGNAIVR